MLSIIIPVFNKINYTLACLGDLFRLESDVEIIIIDNASSDETEAELSKINKSNFIYIKNNENLFHSKACNIGFSKSKGDYVLFLNNDIRVKSNYSNWADNLIKYCDDNIVGLTMGLLDNNLNFVKEENKELIGNSYLSGWFLASSRENFKKLDINNNGQIFDENFPFYYNDTNLSFSAKKLNIQLKIIDLPIVHFGKISSKQLNIHKLYTDGRNLFINKWKK